MTEKYIYKKGVVLLEEWEDVNYCEHTFKFKDDWLDDKEVVDLLNALHEENQQLKLELDTHKHPLWSTREAERKVSELTELLADEVKKNGELLKENNLLRIENKRLKEVQKYE